MAWLNAVPKPAPGTRRADRAAESDAPPPISRIEQYRAEQITPAMPPNPAPHIITRLVEIGLSEAAGMGAVPLSWGTINEWQRATGVRLAPWEARLLHRLSTEYLAEGRRAESENCPSPWRAPISQAERDSDEARVLEMFG